jgi:hypothetical protein
MIRDKIDLMIYDVESFIYFGQKKIDKIVKEGSIISLEDSIFILSNFSETLNKISEIVNKIPEIESKEKADDVCNIALSALAWIIFTIPSLEVHTPLFPENFTIYEKDIIDFLAQSMVELENLKEDLENLKFFSVDIAKNIKEASLLFGHLSKTSEKSIDFN